VVPLDEERGTHQRQNSKTFHEPLEQMLWMRPRHTRAPHGR
jgi:hypothetical protein